MSIETAHFEAELAAAVGVEHVGSLADGMAVSPCSTEEVADVLRVANARRVAVRIVGAGTKQAWSNPLSFDPSKGRIDLHTSRMSTLREHAAQDLTAIVDAGCSWGEMQRQLAEQGQSVALDPLWPEHATIGGIVAANDSGALRLRYGSLRDLIIGMTIVLADGTIARSGGKVVKNVAGYDMHKLMTGAAGTLGVITQVNFRLHPVEKLVKSWTVASSNLGVLADLMHAVRDSQMVVNAMQLRQATNASGEHTFALDAMFAAGEDCMEDQVKWLGLRASPLRVEEAAEDAWLARQRIFDGAKPESVVFRMSVLPQHIARFVSRLSSASDAAALHCAMVAQATGLITASIRGGGASCERALRVLRAEVESDGGSLVILSGPINGAFDRWGGPGDALPLMRRIKHALDLNGILNPGRYLGGI